MKVGNVLCSGPNLQFSQLAAVQAWGSTQFGVPTRSAARAAWYTRRKAVGLMAGPESPPAHVGSDRIEMRPALGKAAQQ